MNIGKFLSPKNDLAFKRIFGTEKNKDILLHFLNDIFGRTTNPIEDVTFLKPVQEPEIAVQRVSIVDILCKDLEGNQFIIEMQVVHQKGFEQRAQYYAAKAYIGQREKGVEYQDLKEVTFLAITEFAVFPNKENYLSHHQMLDIDTHERDLKDFSFSFLELPKFTKSKEDLVTMTEKWAYFFKHAETTNEKELAEIIGDDQILGRAYEELNRFSWSQEELMTYDKVDMEMWGYKVGMDQAFETGMEKGKAAGFDIGMEKGKAVGFDIGIEKGKAEGEKIGSMEATKNIARTMKTMNLAIDKIAEATGLTAAEIDDL